MKLRDTRNRSHPYQLPSKGDSLHDKNFVSSAVFSEMWKFKLASITTIKRMLSGRETFEIIYSLTQMFLFCSFIQVTRW